MDTLLTNLITYFTNLVAYNWGLLVIAAVAVFYFVTHRKVAIAYAVSRIKTGMLAAEKAAETLVLTNGQAKLAWVVDKGYDYLPAAVRLFVSKPLFAALIQREFNVAVAWAEKHIQPVQPVQPVVAPGVSTDIPV